MSQATRKQGRHQTAAAARPALPLPFPQLSSPLGQKEIYFSKPQWVNRHFLLLRAHPECPKPQ